MVQVRTKSSIDTAIQGVKKPIFESNQHIVVATDLVSTVQLKWGVELDVLGTFCGYDLENCSYIHPLENREFFVVVGEDYIVTRSEIGLVHTAPGHGQEDFLSGMKCKASTAISFR